MTASNTSNKVMLGRITGVFGIKGFVKVFSDTDVRSGILNYPAWTLSLNGSETEYVLESGQAHGKGIIAKLKNIDDRDVAAKLIGADISVSRDLLPALPDGEYYWSDLVGLNVSTQDGQDLGQVSHLFSTGANDVVSVKGERERLIPFVQPDVIVKIDLDEQSMIVDWDPEF